MSIAFIEALNLKPCPFCGSTPGFVAVRIEQDKTVRFWIECDDCSCQIREACDDPTSHQPTIEAGEDGGATYIDLEALYALIDSGIRRWNKRAESATDAAREEA